ncbi:MAG: DUF333 domain-containing protein [Candidatus Paceibacterota bacterium]|jgi:hypothetical protein
MKKTLSIIFVLFLIIIGILYYYQQNNQKNITIEKPTDTVINSATFSCAENKTIQTIFFKDKVELTLSDGRNMLLLQAISASGARYANADESFVFWNKGDTAFIEEEGKTTFKECATKSENENITQIANPASTNCSKLGGNLVIEKRGDLGEYGLCYFEDNRACEEWALLRGDCPVGGVKTTGFDAIDQKYCAWSGGQTFAVPNSVCTFKNGSKCSTENFYNGKCFATE